MPRPPTAYPIPDPSRLAAALGEIMSEHNLSLRYFADGIGVSHVALGQLLRGERSWLRPATFGKLVSMNQAAGSALLWLVLRDILHALPTGHPMHRAIMRRAERRGRWLQTERVKATWSSDPAHWLPDFLK